MGQFDDEIDPDGGVTLTPDPRLAPMTATDLGIPPAMMASAVPSIPVRPPVPMPTPPPAPGPPGSPGSVQNIIKMALIGLAAGMGPRHGGTGALSGIAAGEHANDQERQRQFQNQTVQYQQQQQEAIRQQTMQAAQQRAEAAQFEKRQADLQKAVAGIRAEVKAIPNKAEYDQRMEGYANLLRASGYRLDANWLRQAVPYVAPSSEKLARDFMTAFWANPMNKELLKNNPNALATGSGMIDLNQDGIKEKRTIREIMEAGNLSMLLDDTGKPVGIGSSTDGPIANLALKAKVETFKIENRRDPTPKEMDALIAAARTTPPQDPEMAGLTKELARQRLAEGKNKPKAARDPQVQARVDRLSKQFDSLPLVKTTQKMSEAVGFAQGLDPNTKNPADDQALIYAFAKAMDPDSVVREGEYATVQHYARSWAESFGFNAARIFSNSTFLTPQARQNMKRTIMAKFQAGKQQYDAARKSYVDRINKRTGSNDGEDELTDYGSAFPKDAAATAREKLMNR